MGLVALWHVGSSQTRARTHVPCIGRQILNHCATREARYYCIFKVVIFQKFFEVTYLGYAFEGIKNPRYYLQPFPILLNSYDYSLILTYEFKEKHHGYLFCLLLCYRDSKLSNFPFQAYLSAAVTFCLFYCESWRYLYLSLN